MRSIFLESNDCSPDCGLPADFGGLANLVFVILVFGPVVIGGVAALVVWTLRTGRRATPDQRGAAGAEDDVVVEALQSLRRATVSHEEHIDGRRTLTS